MQDTIKVRGARTHNLKNIDVDIPKHKLTTITGLSGSGKSSLAFDTIYAEGQRRYVESLSSYARQFLGLMNKPDVDLIEGLQPAISIDQKTSGHNPRSTVGTVTEIYDYLRLLYARVGHARSPKTGKLLEKQTVQQIVDRILDLGKDKEAKILILSPLIKNRKGTYEELFNRLVTQGFARVRIDSVTYSLEENIVLDKYVKHSIELIVDRLLIRNESLADESFIKRLTDAVELSLNMGDGEMLVSLIESDESKNQNEDIFFSEKLVDPATGDSFPEVEPHSFSFNSPFGACSDCNGLGSIKEIDKSLIYNPRLTIKEGGIFPLHRLVDKEDSYAMSAIEAVALEENFDLRKPIGELGEKHLNIILFGEPKKIYEFSYKNYMGVDKKTKQKFEGIIPWLKKRYEESESEWVRSDIEQYMVESSCTKCNGYRLRHESLAVTIGGKSIADIGNMSISEALEWINLVNKTKTTDLELFKKGSKVYKELFKLAEIDPTEDVLSEQAIIIGQQIFKEIYARLNFLVSVGLNYLTLNRTAKTLSGGESQRIRLASQIGTGLTGVLYVLDEPSIGLHQRDNSKLIKTLEHLRDIGNTVVVVEHDEDTIHHSDYVIDIGPEAGENGGRVLFSGTPKELIDDKFNNSITGAYLRGDKKIDRDELYNEISSIKAIDTDVYRPKKYIGESILITNVQENNLKGFDFELPLGKFVAVTGVSGSGKSTLVNSILINAVAKELNGRQVAPGKFGTIRGIEHIDKLVEIDQSPIGRTPRSNPSTYTGMFTDIRNIFASTKESKERGYGAGRFSFNVKGGRCEKCEGAGVIQISMQFLPDVYVECEICNGKRYNRETLQIDYKGKNISDVLDMTVLNALDFFQNINKIKNKLQTLVDVGLGYIRLGQSATTLSGGESQRIKLSSELAKRSTGRTLYVLDEPTTGLHFEDVRKLLIVLHGLVLKGNTVLVIEHNLDVVKTADWVVDLGPEGGGGGGYIVAQGTVEDVINTKESFTGEWLNLLINKTK